MVDKMVTTDESGRMIFKTTEMIINDLKKAKKKAEEKEKKKKEKHKKEEEKEAKENKQKAIRKAAALKIQVRARRNPLSLSPTDSRT